MGHTKGAVADESLFLQLTNEGGYRVEVWLRVVVEIQHLFDK
jgi:hypothetical protein